MSVRFDPTSPLAYSGCWKCGEYRDEALLSYPVRGHRQCLNCSASPTEWKLWGKCVGCRGEKLPLEKDHVLGHKYVPVMLEPLCRNCHQVKTQSTNHLPNSGDISEVWQRAEGAVLAYAELNPDGFLEIQSISTIAGAFFVIALILVFVETLTRMLKSCKN